MSSSSVSIANITKRYTTADGPVIALENVSLEIGRDQFVSIVGPSGCGKSTMLMMTAGLTKPSDGKILVDGLEVKAPQTNLGIVFQEANLLEWRTIAENVALQAEIRGLDLVKYAEKTQALLDRVGLGAFAKRYPFELSGGMQQRASLCRALVIDPPLLLMDEPFGALDALTRDDMNLELQDIWISSPKTVLFITHSISEAVFLSDRVIVMSPRPGQIVADITIDLPRPRMLRDRETAKFGEYANQIREIFTSLGVLRSEHSRAETK
jgi:NitT/TauT family transport system ATP-binding protein